jgi:hypothetical protein
MHDACRKPAPASREQFSCADPVVQALVEAVGRIVAGVFPDEEVPLAAEIKAHERQRFNCCAEGDALPDRTGEPVQVLAVCNVEVCLDLPGSARSYGISYSSSTRCVWIERLIRLCLRVG